MKKIFKSFVSVEGDNFGFFWFGATLAVCLIISLGIFCAASRLLS